MYAVKLDMVNRCGTERTNGKLGYRACSEDGFHRVAEIFHEFCGNESLHRAGEAAAMNTPSALFAENFSGDRASKGDTLFRRSFCGEIILKKSCTGIAGFLNNSKESCHIFLFERVEHTFYAAVFTNEVERTKNGSVAELFAECGGVFHDGLFRDAAKNGLAEKFSDRLHFRGNSGVIIGEICMRTARVDDAEGIALSRKVKIDAARGGSFRIFEVDGNETTCSASDLVHQTARLAEMHVLCILRDLGNFDVIDLAAVI